MSFLQGLLDHVELLVYLGLQLATLLTKLFVGFIRQQHPLLQRIAQCKLSCFNLTRVKIYTGIKE